MYKKKYIGQLVSIKYTDRPTPFYGFVVDYNDDWTLMKLNSCDYCIDGYVILKHKNIEGFKRDANVRFKEKVIKLKGEHMPVIKDFPLTDLETIFSYLTKHYGVFAFFLKSEKSCYLGRLKSFTRGKLTIDYLNPKGIWTKQMEFRPNDIRTIEFDTDYINSLKLISKKTKAVKIKGNGC